MTLQLCHVCIGEELGQLRVSSGNDVELVDGYGESRVAIDIQSLLGPLAESVENGWSF